MMPGSTVFISNQIPEKGKILLKEAGFKVHQWELTSKIPKQELIKRCKNSDALFSVGANQLDEEFFKECSHLKIVALLSVGYDHVDIDAAVKYKVPVSNTPGVLSRATADTAFLLMLASSRKAFYQYKRIIDGKWVKGMPADILGIELYNKTLGIFGLGRIGMEMARLCQATYHMNIIYHNRNRNKEAEAAFGAEWVDFDELLSNSDVLSVHSELTEETQGRFDISAFSKMKPTAIFINTSRGGVHNETDLIKALKNKFIWGAGLDVTNPEPMSKDNPLLNMPSVTVLPHIGSATVETRNDMAVLAAQNIIAVFNHEPLPSCINPEVFAET